jgi:hypothetical protein
MINSEHIIVIWWGNFSYTQDRGQADATGCNAPTTNLDAPTRNLQNTEHEHADQPAKNRDTLPHPRVASVELPWFETTHFQKCMHVHDGLCNVLKPIMELKCSFCSHEKGTFYACA